MEINNTNFLNILLNTLGYRGDNILAREFMSPRLENENFRFFMLHSADNKPLNPGTQIAFIGFDESDIYRPFVTGDQFHNWDKVFIFDVNTYGSDSDLYFVDAGIQRTYAPTGGNIPYQYNIDNYGGSDIYNMMCFIGWDQLMQLSEVELPGVTKELLRQIGENRKQINESLAFLRK